jgi:hypothetical protein
MSIGLTVASMRLDADWMSCADDRILEHLADDGPDTPKQMAESGRVRFSRQRSDHLFYIESWAL